MLSSTSRALAARWFAVTLLAASPWLAACGDSGSKTGATDTLTSDTSDTSSGEDTTTGQDTSGDVIPGAPTVTTGTLAETTLCPGGAVSVPFTFSGTAGVTYYVNAELSDASGSFEDAERIGQSTGSSGAVDATIPEDISAGTGYRIRVTVPEYEVVAADSGQDLEVLVGPQIEITVSPQIALAGDNVRFVDASSNVASRTWTFPADASVQTSAEGVVDVTFSETGPKEVTLAVEASTGCAASQTVTNRFDSVEIVSCEPSVPADAEVIETVEDERRVGGGYTAWMCGGGGAAGFGGAPTIFVEPGATFEYEGGGGYLFYVRAGGRFIGGSGGTAYIVSEPGAFIGEHSSEVRLDCDALTFDYTDAPTGGCVPAGVDPASVEAVPGAVPSAPVCPGADLDVPFTLTGTVGASNQIIAQLSDEDGDFTNAVNLDAVSATASGSASFTLPRELPAGDGYRVRLLTSHPPTIGSASGAFSVPEAPVARIGIDVKKALVDTDVTFTNDSDDGFTSSAWDFGEGASPGTATTTDGTTQYTTPGWKTVSLTITGPNGCMSTATVERDEDVYDSGFEALSCEVTVPSDAEVYGPGTADLTGGDGTVWVCGGAQVGLFGGARTAVVEELGLLDFGGGGQQRFYVRSGGRFLASPGGLNTLLYETGAEVVDADYMTYAFECPTLTVNLADAPDPGCEPYTPPEPSLTIGEPEETTVCHGDGLSVPFTTTGIFPLSNRFVLQLSDASGSFDAPIEIGSTDSAVDGAVYGRIDPDDAAAGTGYRVRVVSEDPELVSEPADAVITVGATPDVQLGDVWFAEKGATFTIPNDTVGGATWRWTVDDALYSEEEEPSFMFDDHGSHDIELEAFSADGCVDDDSRIVKVYSCNPPIPATATVVTGSVEQFGGLKRYWVCDGGVVDAGAGDHQNYVEAGGQVDNDSGGVYLSYVKSGGHYSTASSGIRGVVYETGADVTLPSDPPALHMYIECPTLTFDTSVAPNPGCGE